MFCSLNFLLLRFNDCAALLSVASVKAFNCMSDMASSVFRRIVVSLGFLFCMPDKGLVLTRSDKSLWLYF